MTIDLINVPFSSDFWRIEAEGGIGKIDLRIEYEPCLNEDTLDDDEGEDDTYLLVTGLFVDPANRGMGLGRRLLRAALAFANGMPIRLSAKPLDEATDQNRLVAFYESEGFSIAKEQSGEGVFMER